MTLNIVHTHEEGTLITGTARGDGSGDILKRTGWRWGRSIGAWYVPHSRDRNAKLHVVDPARDALEAAGFIVTADIDNTARSAAEVEAAKAERAEHRADALAAKAERKAAAAEQAASTAHAAVDRLPWGGEPVKIGHHSEGRHRRDIGRAHATMGKSVAAGAEADTAAARAAIAARATAARHAPVTVGNRIEKLKAEVRSHQRTLNGYTRAQGSPYQEEVPPATGAMAEQARSLLAVAADHLAYWESVRESQISEGIVKDIGPDTVKAGDTVHTWGGWRKVRRVNKKSVSVESGYSWTDRVPWHEIRDHSSAATAN